VVRESCLVANVRCAYRLLVVRENTCRGKLPSNIISLPIYLIYHDQQCEVRDCCKMYVCVDMWIYQNRLSRFVAHGHLATICREEYHQQSYTISSYLLAVQY
jgi:hypothetical protein